MAQKAPKSGLTAALVAGTNENLAERVAALTAHLERPGASLPPGGFFNETPLLAGGGKLALIFPGQGSQYVGMLRELVVLFPEMRAVVEKADATLSARMSEKGLPNGELSRAIFARAMYGDAARAAVAGRLTRTDVAQPALGAIEAGLLEVLRRLGLHADMAAGHSYGEFVALYAAGVMSLEELLLVSEARGRFMIEAAAGRDLGTMAAVRAECPAVESAIAGMADVWVANHNMPTQTVLSGTKAGVAAAGAELERAGLSVQPIEVGAAFHSPIVAPAAEPLAALIQSLPLKAPNIAVYSNRTAKAYPTDVASLRAELAEHLISPVQFVAEIEAMYADGARVFVSVGPRGSQASMIRNILGEKSHRTVVCDDGTGGISGLLQSIGALLTEGAELDLARLWRGRDCRLLGDSLAVSPRGEKPAAHMWLLNGSGARPYGTPPAPVLTLEDAAQLRLRTEQRLRATEDPTAAPPGASELSRIESNAPHLINRRIGPRSAQASRSRSAREEKKVMTGDDPTGDREAALVEFQATMQRFLEAQENIMLAYLNGSQPARAERTAGVAADEAHGGRPNCTGAAARLARASRPPARQRHRRHRKRRDCAARRCSKGAGRSRGTCRPNSAACAGADRFGGAASERHCVGQRPCIRECGGDERFGDEWPGGVWPGDDLRSAHQPGGRPDRLSAGHARYGPEPGSRSWDRFDQAGGDSGRAAEVAARRSAGEDCRSRRRAQRAENAQRHPRSVVVEDWNRSGSAHPPF